MTIRPLGMAGAQDHVYMWTHNDLSRQALAPEPRASRSPNAAGPSRLDDSDV